MPGSTPHSCVICGGSLAPAVPQPPSSYSSNGAYRIDACGTCGTGMTTPWPDADELARLYATDYGYSTHDLIEPEKRRRSAAILRWSGVGSGRVLDVGCMYGFLLDEAAELGIDTHGLELSPTASAIARDKGHRVFAGTVEDYAAANPDLRFDAVFAQHVLEHVPDPVEFLRIVRGLLVPGGKVVLCVPNFEARLRRLAPGAWGWYQVPFHLLHFTSRSLRAAVEAAGLSISVERTNGGDTLFLAQSAAQFLGVTTGVELAGSQPALARVALRVLSEVTRPYYSLGDDELAIIAHA